MNNLCYAIKNQIFTSARMQSWKEIHFYYNYIIPNAIESHYFSQPYKIKRIPRTVTFTKIMIMKHFKKHFAA